MMISRLTGALMAGLILAGCTNPGRFDGQANTVDLNAQNALDASAAAPDSPGYFTTTIGDRVLRAAMVTVSTGVGAAG